LGGGSRAGQGLPHRPPTAVFAPAVPSACGFAPIGRPV